VVLAAVHSTAPWYFILGPIALVIVRVVIVLRRRNTNRRQ